MHCRTTTRCRSSPHSVSDFVKHWRCCWMRPGTLVMTLFENQNMLPLSWTESTSVILVRSCAMRFSGDDSRKWVRKPAPVSMRVHHDFYYLVMMIATC